MRERWHENILKIRLVDERGEVRRVWRPSARKLRRAGLAHPYRFNSRLASWRDLALMFATYVAVLLVIAVIFEFLGPLVGFNPFDEPDPDQWANQIGIWDPLVGHFAPLIGTVALALYATLKVGNRRVAARYVRNLLKYAKCPWCLYDLSGSVADESGLTTCPECGGVWKMEDVPARGG